MTLPWVRRALWIAVCVAIVFWRLQSLYLLPRFGDEWGEVWLSYQVAYDHLWPLHNTAHDMGALFNYLVAGALRLSSGWLGAARALTAFCGLANVALAALWAKRLYGSWAAMVCAVLLGTTAPDILNGHMAWSNNIAPCLLTASMLALTLAEGHAAAPRMLLAGALFGLALQAHSSIAALIPGVLCYVIAERKRWPRWAPWVGIGAATATYSNMIYYNLATGFDSWHWDVTRKGYALSLHTTPSGWSRHLGSMLLELWRDASSALGAHAIRRPELLWLVLALGWLVFLMVGALRRGPTRLPVLLLLSAFLVIPYFNKSYALLADSRYIGDLLAPLWVLVAGGLLALARWFGAWQRPFLLAAMLVTAVHAIYALASWQRVQVQHGRSNQAAWQMARRLRPQWTAGASLWMDARLQGASRLPDMLRTAGWQVRVVGNPWRPQFNVASWCIADRRGPAAVLLLHEDRLALGSCLHGFRFRPIPAPDPTQQLDMGTAVSSVGRETAALQRSRERFG